MSRIQRDFGYLLEARKSLWAKEKQARRDQLVKIELKMKSLDRNSIEYRELEAKRINLTLELYGQEKKSDLEIQRLLKKHEIQTKREQADFFYKYQAKEIKKAVLNAVGNATKNAVSKLPIIKQSIATYKRAKEIYDSTKSKINATRDFVKKTADFGAKMVLTKKIGGKGIFHVGGRRVAKYDLSNPYFAKYSKNLDQKQVIQDNNDIIVQDGILYYKKKGKFQSINPDSQLSLYDFYEYLKGEDKSDDEISEILHNAREMNAKFSEKALQMISGLSDVGLSREKGFKAQLGRLKQSLQVEYDKDTGELRDKYTDDQKQDILYANPVVSDNTMQPKKKFVEEFDEDEEFEDYDLNSDNQNEQVVYAINPEFLSKIQTDNTIAPKDILDKKQQDKLQKIQTASVVNMDEQQREQFFAQKEAERNARKINDDNIAVLKETLAEFYVNVENMKKPRKKKDDEDKKSLLNTLVGGGKGSIFKAGFKRLGTVLLHGAKFLFMTPVGLAITATVGASLYFFGPWLKDKLFGWWNKKDNDKLADQVQTDTDKKLDKLIPEVDSEGNRLDADTKKLVSEISDKTGESPVEVLNRIDAKVNNIIATDDDALQKSEEQRNKNYAEMKQKYGERGAKVRYDAEKKKYENKKKAEISKKVAAGELTAEQGRSELKEVRQGGFEANQIKQIVREDTLKRELSNPTKTKVQAEKQAKLKNDSLKETPQQKVARQVAFEQKLDQKPQAVENKEIDEQAKLKAKQEAEKYREAVYKYRWNKYKSGEEKATKANGYEEGKIYNKGIFGYDYDTNKKINDYEYFKKANQDKIEKWERLGTNDTAARLNEKAIARGYGGQKTYEERLQSAEAFKPLVEQELKKKNAQYDAQIAKQNNKDQIENRAEANRIESDDSFKTPQIEPGSGSVSQIVSNSTPTYNLQKSAQQEQQASQIRAQQRVNAVAQAKQNNESKQKPLNRANSTIDNVLGGSGLNITNYPRRAQ